MGHGFVDENCRDGGGGSEGLGVEDSAAGRGIIQQQRQRFAELFGFVGAGLAGGFGEPSGKGFLVVVVVVVVVVVGVNARGLAWVGDFRRAWICGLSTQKASNWLTSLNESASSS